MTLRERLADWISGGMLKNDRRIANEAFNDAYQKTRRLHRSNSALLNIIAEETPGANATVKRMARIAWDERVESVSSAAV